MCSIHQRKGVISGLRRLWKEKGNYYLLGSVLALYMVLVQVEERGREAWKRVDRIQNFTRFTPSLPTSVPISSWISFSPLSAPIAILPARAGTKWQPSNFPCTVSGHCVTADVPSSVTMHSGQQHTVKCILDISYLSKHFGNGFWGLDHEKAERKNGSLERPVFP